MTGYAAGAWTDLRDALKEAVALGVTFRIAGAGVSIDGIDRLPDPLAGAIEAHRSSGLLWHYLGAREFEVPALALAAQLGIPACLIETASDARDAVWQLILDARQNAGHVAIDIETTPRPGCGKPRPPVALNKNGCLSARQPTATEMKKDRTALDPHQARAATAQLYAGGEQCFVFRGAAMDLVLGSHWLRRQHLVAHNLGFEAAFIRQHARPAHRSGRRRGSMDCTLQAAGLVLGVGFHGEGRSLVRTAKDILGVNMPKDLQVSDWGAATLSPGQVAYAASDAIVTWRLWPILRDRMEVDGTLAAYRLQRGAIPAVVAMEHRGLGIDRPEHARQSDEWARDLAAARRAFVDETGYPPPSKDAEIRDWLRRVLSPLDLSRWPLTPKTGELSTSTKSLRRLVETVPSAPPVLTILAKGKLVSSFGASLVEKISPVTGRIHCSFNIAAAKSGRFSSNDPNLQQLPSKAAPEFRRCIHAEDGMTLIASDYNQVEVRAAAWCSNDPALTQLYLDGGDLHTENAAMIMGISVDAFHELPLNKQREFRSKAKAVTFGALFGIGAEGLVGYAFTAFNVTMTLIEAEAALATFFGRFPTLKAWLREHSRQCVLQQFVRIGAGRLVRDAWELYPLRYQQHCNLPIQGICADAMLLAMRLAHSRLEAADVRGGIVATVHDEILLEVDDAQVDLASRILEQAMLAAFQETFPGAPCSDVTKLKSGKTWDME